MKPGDIINVSPIVKPANKSKLICPLISSKGVQDISCYEAGCAWWNSHFAYCSVRGVHDLIFYLQELAKQRAE